MPNSPTILGLASEFKGAEFIKECHRQGCRIIILAREAFKDHPWPHECIDQFHTMPDLRIQPDLTNAVCYLMRHQKIDRIVALDDFDVEHAGDLREHLRMPGMGHSQARLFRDKLAMRSQAQLAGIPEPDFCGVVNHNDLYQFMTRHNPPWIFKPRTLAGSEGIMKFSEQQDLWHKLEQLGDQQSQFLLEQFLPGQVFHVDALSWRGEVVFALASRYGEPPLAMLQGQGLFSTSTLDQSSPEAKTLLQLNQILLKAFGRDYGPTHSEFILGADGQFYFLETSARVAGGNIEQVLRYATGIKIWQEAAKMELADWRQKDYQLPKLENNAAALIACPLDKSNAGQVEFSAPEVKFQLQQDRYITLVLQAKNQALLQGLIEHYSEMLIS